MSHIPIIARAIEHAERIAVHSGSGTHTYDELLSASQNVAAAILDGSDDLNEARVAYLIPAGADYLAAQWGIWRAGGIAVPLSLSATEKELEYTLTDSEVSTVIVTAALTDKVAGLCERLTIRLVRSEDVPSATNPQLPEVSTDRRAMILYTSGTTSTPKGVVTTHACITAQIQSLIEAWHWQTDDRIPLFLPLHHIHGIINIMSCALWSGAQVEPLPRFDVNTILARVADDAYTVFMAVPTIYVKLIEALDALPDAQREPITSGFARMRLMISGSAALPASIHEKWTELTGQKLLERYGMTEIGMGLSNPYKGERRPGAVGQPLPDVKLRLQSSDGETITEDGVSGEIQVRGPSVFSEYWNRPEPTEAAFTDGWFRTGDIAVIEDGYFRIMGRSSVEIITSGGYKLSALEIEASLLDHPAITQCAVVGIADDTWGEVVAVAVVLKQNEELTLAALQSWSEDRISSYKQPRKLLVVDELPRNAMGKVKKPAVVELF